MKTLFKILSYLGLVFTILPCFLLVSNVIDMATSKSLMLVGTIMWFGTALLWIKKDKVSL